MAIKHKVIEINSSTSTMITDSSDDNDFYLRKLNISVQNLSSDKYVFIGNSTLTNSSFGVRLDPAEIISIDLSPEDELYAMSDSGTFNISVLKVYSR